MFFDIFSSFDDHNRVFMNMNYLMWILVMMITMSLSQFVWLKSTSTTSIVSMILNMVTEELVSRTEAKKIGSSFSIFCSLLTTLLLMNLLGLIPYIFSLTSHLAVNFSISLPLWLSIVMMSMSSNLTSFLAHLQPTGSPAPLNPFLCIIELVSLLVRPLTLAVRLTANLSTGHILMALLGTGFIASHISMGMMIMLMGMFYFIFEMAVCFIQSYIFTLLPTLYLDEHPTNNKN